MQVFQISAEAEKLRALEQQLTGFLDDDGIPHHTDTQAGLVLRVVQDPYEGDWFYVLLPDQLLGVYAAPAEDLLAAIARFAKPEDKRP